LESDGVRNGPDYSGCTIYYPNSVNEKHTSIIIVPGYISYESSISEWGPFFASHGIVTMTIGTNSIFDYPETRASALLDGLISLEEENTRPNSPLNGKLNTSQIALGGWSMGGGGAQIAATLNPSIKAIVALCPWLDPLFLTNSQLNHNVPVLFLSGQLDLIAAPAYHANEHYELTPDSTPKLLFEISGAGHNVANGPSGGNGEVGIMALSWLQEYLIGNNCFCPILLETPLTASTYNTNILCEVLSNDVQQEIECAEGWSIISTYINPENQDFSEFIAPILNELVIAKNNEGNAYLPDWDFNGIGDLSIGQAYLIKMQSTITLTVSGELLAADENPISLNEGWNLVSYLKTEASNSDETFSSLITSQNIIIVKDYVGNALLPEWDFNGLGDLFPGRGYQIKVNNDCELQY
tara:strand:- start:1162 stop:2394 length:1233 start_codon:yes stop_codon:yes gene_type:complete